MAAIDLSIEAGDTAAPGVPGSVQEHNPHHAKRWLILGVLGLAQLMVVLDATVVNIALPSAQAALKFSNDDRQWIVTAYSLAFGSLLLLGGRLADMFGRKQMFLIGLVGFAVASVVGGAANGFGVLVTARAVQGAFGAVLAPAALSLLTTTFTERTERSKAFGIYGAIGGGGAAVGLLLGGFLTEYLSWRWCMFINVGFAVFAIVGGFLLLHAQRGDDPDPLDVPGTVLVTTGLFSVVYGFAHAETKGWSNAVTLGAIALGLVLVAAFVALETRVSHPLLPIRVLMDRNRGGAYLALFASGIGMFALFLFLTYYLQEQLGFSALKSGLAFLPMVLVLMVASQIGTNVLGSRVGPRWIIGPGMLLAGLGLLLLTRLDTSSSFGADVLPWTLVVGAGLGLIFSSALSNATFGVKSEDAGVASAMSNVGQQVGGSIGTALLSTLAATATANYLHSHGAESVVARSAAIHGYTTVFGWAALIFAVGGLLTGAVLRGSVAAPQEGALPHAG